jgi:AcrR family transcriptional regulator
MSRARSSRGDGGAPEVVRRAPFAENPHVGARGQRTQQRILDAALEAFGEDGYDLSSVDSIATRAGCSRAAFYQYFESKESVFRHLTGLAARQLDASTEALAPITPDAAGWLSVRAWTARHSDIYRRYASLFHVFQDASASDAALATGSRRWSARAVARIRSRIAATPLRPRDVEPVILLLLECVARTHDVAHILHASVAGHYTEERVGDALADVLHRSLFGLQQDVNVHRPAPRRPPVVAFDPIIREAFAQSDPDLDPASAGRKTWESLLAAGRTVFAERGYHRTRVSDVAEAAGVSRAWFYRYFGSKDQLARTLTTRAMQTVSRVLAEFPGASIDGSAAGRTALRRWLRRYNVAQTGEVAMLRVWVDAALQDSALRANSAAALDWGRRALLPFLERRGFGDADTEAVILVALLSAFGARERTPLEVNAAAHVVEQGLLCV